jgi:hypothetical protein
MLLIYYHKNLIENESVICGLLKQNSNFNDGPKTNYEQSIVRGNPTTA